MSQTNVTFPNIAGLKVKISNLEVYPRQANFENETILLSNVTIEEDMFAESVVGSVELMDPSPNLAYTNLISLNDPVTISFDGNTFKFVIVDINIVSDLASKKVIGPDGAPRKVIVRFASDSFLNLNYNFVLYEDFIGKISAANSDADDFQDQQKVMAYVPGVNIPKASQILGSDYIPLQGFLQAKVAPALDKPLKADPTFNDLWLKHDATHYPYSKLGSSVRLSQIMNYICEYACDLYNPNAVNFFFWEDLFGWNFRSIEGIMTKDYKDTDNVDLPYFTPLFDENNKGAIVSFEVINAVTPSKLKNAGAYLSEYIRIKPLWENTYNFVVDTAANLSKRRYIYNYKTDSDRWAKIASKPINKNFIGISGAQSDTLRITDNNYGYYNTNPYNQKETPWWNFYEDYSIYANTGVAKQQPDRLEKEFWQSQFDFCELPGDYLNIIYFDIKWNEDRWQATRQYAYYKRLKAEWETYKNNICCERKQPETFFALLTKAQKIYGGNGETFSVYIESERQSKKVKMTDDAGGIWAYEWTEVEFWPRKEADKIPKTKTGQKWSDYSIIEFQDNSFPFVFLKPKGGMQGIGPKGAGYVDTRAYNLNEILNSRIPKEFENVSLETGQKGFPYTLIINPGITDTLGYTGSAAGKTEYNSYPKNFRMMPVGKFRVLGSQCPPNSEDYGIEGVTTGNKETYFYQGGRIVQMYRIPKETLTAIQGKTLTNDIVSGPTDYEKVPRKGIENLYVFDVENAHDGLCTDC